MEVASAAAEMAAHWNGKERKKRKALMSNA